MPLLLIVIWAGLLLLSHQEQEVKSQGLSSAAAAGIIPAFHLDNNAQRVTVLLNLPAEPKYGYTGIVEQLQQQPNQKLQPAAAVVAFRGIPYAKPPLGTLRYQPPVAYQETEIRDAAHFSSPCLQWDLFHSSSSQGNVTGSEDCLHLNIFKPHLQDDDLRARAHHPLLLPVMVFFHGVGFVAGQSDTYNPEYLVEKGVIVVTVQYRLGALGFLSTGDKLQPGNMGMLDQVEALRWVARYIHSFGGDPEKVTIFGESAGAVAVTLHLLSPLTRGLFRAAIIQSGTSLAPYAIQRSPMTHIQRLAANLGCISGNTEALLECIKYSDPREVIASDANSMVSGNERKASRSHKKPPNPGPVIQEEVVEGWPTFLSEDPLIALQQGRFHQVPIIIGVNRDESASAVISNLLPRLSNITETDPTYPERVFLKKVVKSSGITNNTEYAKAAIKFEYFKNYPLSDVSELRDEYISLHSDFSVVAPVYKTAIYFSKRTTVFFYTFEYEGEHSFSQILMQAPDREPRPVVLRRRRQAAAGAGAAPRKEADFPPAAIDKLLTEITPEVVEQLEKLGGEAFHFDTEQSRYVIHGEELLYVFRFRNPSSGTIIDIEDEEGAQVRNIMTTLWTNMAKYGMPTTTDNETRTTTGSSAAAVSSLIVPWKPFLEDGPYTLKITDKTSLLISYRHRKMLFWTHFLPQLQTILPSSCFTS